MEIVVNLAKTDTIYVNFANLVENSKERVSLLKLTPPNIVRWFRTMIFCRFLSLSLSHSHKYSHFGLFKIWLDALCHCCFYDYYQNLNMMLFSLSVSVFHLACTYFSSSIIFLPLCLYIKYAYKTFSFNFKFKLCIREMFHKVCNWHWVVWASGLGGKREILGWVQSWMHMCVAFLGLIFFESHSFSRNFVFAVDTFNTSYIWYEVLKNICNTFSFKQNIKQAKINQSIGLCMFVLYIKLVLKMRLTTFIW